MNKASKRVAVLTGDVNGIGAEITIKALCCSEINNENVVIISNNDVLNYYDGNCLNERFEVIDVPFDKNNIQPGEITKESGEFSFQCLKLACEMAQRGQIQGIVTAPVSKEALHLAGHKFNGQTEVLHKFLARGSQHAEMLFVADGFRVLLLTRHVALKDIHLKKENVISKISYLKEFFENTLRLSAPKFALCALNPHAGEGGILGSEELEVLIPAAEILRLQGINITKPLPADTLFIDAAKAYLKGEPLPFDCYIATYHDQGLIPIKSVASDKTVNMTIGLDVIRTSPCHGTAFDIAGQNLASADSMSEAIKLCLSANDILVE